MLAQRLMPVEAYSSPDVRCPRTFFATPAATQPRHFPRRINTMGKMDTLAGILRLAKLKPTSQSPSQVTRTHSLAHKRRGWQFPLSQVAPMACTLALTLFNCFISSCDGSKSINRSPLDLSIMMSFGYPTASLVESINCSSCMLSALSSSAINDLGMLASFAGPAPPLRVEGSYVCSSSMRSLVGETSSGHFELSSATVIL